eukprot:TRINITY_DN49742_c0_g1_i1.p1 TRINITY_DN49742_c0_g1~~TRINITY_DN49742_c0_g1_i1.p1  ORF type:complete len:212 (+),score=35.85 TRINITY_DN49742_c0_g1_i1:89-637(+)
MESATSFVLQSKLADLKQKKKERDLMIASRIATIRDRVHWLSAFYVVMIGANLFRGRKLRAAGLPWEPLPISYLPFVATPFAFAYQADFAYGNKAERINAEVQNIIKNEKHWFNDPLLIPAYLKPVYDDMQRETNEKLKAMGVSAEPEWATFDDQMTSEETLHHSFPVTRLLYGGVDGLLGR